MLSISSKNLFNRELEMKHKLNISTAWLACLSCALFFMFDFMQATTMDTLSEPIMQSLHLSAFQLANISSAYFLSNILLLIPAGLLLDRYSTRTIVLIALLISILGLFLLSISQTIYMAIIARLISGVASAFTFISCMRVISRYFTADKTAKMISITITIAFLGGIASHYPVALLLNKLNWRHVLQFYVWVGALIFLLNYWLLRLPKLINIDNELLNNSIPSNTKQIISSIKKSIRNYYVLTGSLYTMLLNLPVLLFGALWSNIYLNQIDRLSTISAAFVTSFIFIGLIIGTPLVGVLATSSQRIARLMFIGAILSFTMILNLIFYHTLSTIELSILFLGFGLASSTQSLGYTVVINGVEHNITSIASSITSVIVMGGGSILKIVFGIILDANWNGKMIQGIRQYSNQSFQLGLIMIALCFIFGVIISMLYANKIKKINASPIKVTHDYS
jgi:MFS family permease